MVAGLLFQPMGRIAILYLCGRRERRTSDYLVLEAPSAWRDAKMLEL